MNAFTSPPSIVAKAGSQAQGPYGFMKGKKVFIVANTAFFVQNFLMAIIHELQASGTLVTVVCPDAPNLERIQECGAGFLPLSRLSRKGMNPLEDARLLLELMGMYRREKPDLVLHFTVKPNIYGSIACGLLGKKCISAITGLGYLFIKKGPVNLIARGLYKAALRFADKTIFLNADDLAVFADGGLVDPGRAVVIPGTGIDAAYFDSRAASGRSSDQPLIFLMSGRLLWDKGIGEYVDAARIVKNSGRNCEFWILGSFDEGNPSGVPSGYMSDCDAEGAIKYLGQTSDVREYIGKCDVVVLPSYREGIPRTLLEAMAMRKPIIAADSSGCRDVVENGMNGLLVPVKDSQALAKAMIAISEMTPEIRMQFGDRGREKVLAEFDDKVVSRLFLMHLTDTIRKKNG